MVALGGGILNIKFEQLIVKYKKISLAVKAKEILGI